MSDAIREAFEALRNNICSDDGNVKRMGVYDNAVTRNAIAVLLDNEAALQSQTAPAVPEGWELRKVEAEETTISVHRKSDGRWCAGGQLGAYGRHGLLFEFFDAMLDAGKVVQDSPIGWIWDTYGQRNFTAGTHHKNVLEADGLTLIPVYTHPAESREEIQAQALEKFADWLKRQSFAHNKRWTSAANEALRCAKRLRASQQEGG